MRASLFTVLKLLLRHVAQLILCTRIVSVEAIGVATSSDPETAHAAEGDARYQKFEQPGIYEISANYARMDSPLIDQVQFSVQDETRTGQVRGASCPTKSGPVEPFVR